MGKHVNGPWQRSYSKRKNIEAIMHVTCRGNKILHFGAYKKQAHKRGGDNAFFFSNHRHSTQTHFYLQLFRFYDLFEQPNGPRFTLVSVDGRGHGNICYGSIL